MQISQKKKKKKQKTKRRRNKMKNKVCKKCKIFVDGNECQICKGNVFSTNWQGRMFIVDPTKSLVAEKIGLKVKGEYAIKVR